MKTYNHIRLIFFLVLLTGAAVFDLFGKLKTDSKPVSRIEAATCCIQTTRLIASESVGVTYLRYKDY